VRGDGERLRVRWRAEDEQQCGQQKKLDHVLKLA
jgi:hypothetical protein